MYTVKYQDLGIIEYKEAWEYQEKLFNEVIDIKKQNNDLPLDQQLITPNFLLFCEHPHVYTLGKSGEEGNLLVDYLQLQAKHATFFRTNRGGDITYHGPGQIVGYPILNLSYFVKGAREYIEKLEEAIIQVVADYGIQSERLEGATGVWLDTKRPGKTRKICAIGVRTSHWVSMHGFAFNVNTDLNYFNMINPCGFTDKSVTSLQKELGREVPMEEVRILLKEKIAEVFGFKLI
ncbi:MAG: lipoyl(octanoyl) transferase LipB [Bacteroidetes bacterium]|nr:lipoyl(octanoyl) transferase LipB [Bacteroidota bacterium]